MKKITVFSFSEKGNSVNLEIAKLLSSDAEVEISLQSADAGSLVERTERAFKGDALIFVGAAGIAVRAIAPFIRGKDKDPAVIVIDELKQHVIPILSGHLGGANDLARSLAELLSAEEVITTATDINKVFAVDSFASERGIGIENPERIKDVSAALLRNEEVGISLSPFLSDIFPKTLHLVPKCLCLGVGCRKGTEYGELRDFILGFLKDRNIALSAVSDIASIDIKRDEEAIRRFSEEYSLNLFFFSADELKELPDCFTFSESDFVLKETGVSNVCERSAVKRASELCSFDRVRLLEKKQVSKGMTLAIALYDGTGGIKEQSPKFNEHSTEKESSDKGCISVIGLGPGRSDMLTPEARSAITASDVVIGYRVYLELIRELTEGKRVISSEMRKERERCERAREYALKGQRTAIVCSGDSGVYGMAGLVLEVCRDYPDIEVTVIPGVTAALAGGALLGSPLTNDFSVISLSDHLTEKETIHKRLRAAGEADLVTVLYNPKSRIRQDSLKEAVEILMEKVPPDRVCGYVKNIGREGEIKKLCTLRELPEEDIDMFTTVFIGNSDTVIINGRMVTERGYREA